MNNIEIALNRAGNLVKGRLSIGINAINLDHVDNFWTPWERVLLNNARVGKPPKEFLRIKKSHFQTGVWDWREIVAGSVPVEDYWLLSVTADGMTQGLMAIEKRVPSPLQHRSLTSYVHYVMVAPWNQSNPLNQRTYSGVGKALFIAAADLTIGINNTYLGLHSVQQSEGYYKKMGLKPKASFKETMRYFEGGKKWLDAMKEG